MNDSDGLRQEIAALRERNSSLHAAILRISASLDLDTVLRELVASACALIGARYGMIATVDDDGEIEKFIAPGLSAHERRDMVRWPHGYPFFAHLRDLPGPLRLADVPAYVRSLGYTEDFTLSNTLLATPIRHAGVHVGVLFLGEKAGAQEFADEDEEILVMFASLAATAIANARRISGEGRARVYLETLMETAPVGVVVIDADTGKTVSHNRESARIADRLRTPGQTMDDLLEVIAVRRGDGREFSFRELPLSQCLTDADTVRAEEIVLSVPDGRQVRTLTNATPILSTNGCVGTLVVTVQDLAPIQEIERRRAQFVDMVSHELRAPLMAIQGCAVALLDPSASVPAGETREYVRLMHEQAVHMRGLISDLLDSGHIAAGTLTVAPESSEVAELVEQAKNTFLSGDNPHRVLSDLPADLPRVMVERRRVVQVLNNLLANAARHSAPGSPIHIAAERHGAQATISVSDKGRGVPPERLRQLFGKHTGNAGAGPGIGGGLGLSICKGLVEAHGGRIWAESGGLGQGARFTFTLPAVEPTDAVGSSATRRPGSAAEGKGDSPILVVDDDPHTLRYVRDALSGAGYRAIVTEDPGKLPGLIRTEAPRLVLLGLALPGVNGVEVMERAPELGDVPVICMSAYGRDEAIAGALQAGVADYIVKPFTPTELIARIGMALRKRAEPEPMTLGALAIDFDRRRASLEGRALDLTATEFELLRVLALNVGRVVSYDALIRKIWNGRGHGNTVLVRGYVKRLRCKLGEDTKAPAYIVNTRGVGYRIKRPGDS